MGYRETMVPFKTGLIVVAAVAAWTVAIGEVVMDAFGCEALLWAVVAAFMTVLTVQRLRTVRR